MKAINIKTFAASLIILLLLHAGARADTFKSVEAARTTIDSAMAKIGSGDLDAGFAMFKPYTAVPAAEVDAVVGQAKLQSLTMSQRYGKPIGYEFLAEDKLGKSFARLTYMLRHEQNGVRWVFILYNGSQGWNINSFYYTDRAPQYFPN